MTWLLAGLAGAGLVIAASFTAAFYRPDSTLARLAPPELCGLDPDKPGCGTVILTPGARVFGLPNALLGVTYYLVVLGVTLLGFPGPVWPWLLVAAWFTVAFGAYLGYRLLRVERMSCPLCWTAHALNTVLAIALSVAARSPL